MVVETILNKGKSNPLFRLRVIWGSFQGIVAAVLLAAGGNAALNTLQTAPIIAALPFSVIVVLTCIAIFRCLSCHPSTPELDACEEVA